MPDLLVSTRWDSNPQPSAPWAEGLSKKEAIPCSAKESQILFQQGLISPTGLEPVTFGSGDRVSSFRREARKAFCGQ